MRPLVLAGALAACATAQVMTQPPALLRVIRAPGITGDAGKRYANRRAQVHVFGMASISGAAESWLMEAHDSFASVEQLEQVLGLDSAVRDSTSMIANYRPGFSYRPAEAIQQFVKARYFQVSMYQVGLSDSQHFAELVKARRAGLDSVNLDRPEIAYEVISGAPSGTYILITPLQTLKVLDDGLVRLPPHVQPAVAAAARAGEKVAADGDMLHQSTLLRVWPAMSYVSDEFAEGDKDFWRGQ